MLRGRAGRVDRLEKGWAGPCPECGFGPEDDNKPFEIVFVDPHDDASGGENTYCATCGRPIHITLTWGNEE